MFIKDGDSGENLLGKGYAKVHTTLRISVRLLGKAVGKEGAVISLNDYSFSVHFADNK